MGAGPGPLWPWRGISAPYGIALAVVLAVLLGVVPCLWVLVARRSRAGPGPLWPIVLFEVFAFAYVLVVPPWQKPDEPQHMLHVEVTRVAGVSAAEKLLPTGSQPPALVAADRRIETDITRSMHDTDAVRWLPDYAGNIAINRVPGPTELPHPPLYYVLAAGLTRPFGGTTELARLAVVRVFGVALAAGVVWCCSVAGAMVLGRRVAEVPALIAVALPAFTLLAGSANNDVLAELLAAVLMLVLIAGVLDRTRLARPLPWLATVAVLLVLGLFTKRTFIPLGLVAGVAGIIRLRGHTRALLGATAAILALAAIVVATRTTPRLALWQTFPTGAPSRCAGGTDGHWSICLDPPAQLVSQRLAVTRIPDLEGQDVRLWLTTRATGPGTTLRVTLGSAVSPVIDTVLHPDATWRYMQLDGHVPDNAHYLELNLTRFGPGDVQIDNVGVEAVGWLVDGSPTSNEIANGSAERAVAGSPRGVPGSVRRAAESAVDAAAGVVYQPREVAGSFSIVAKRATQTFSSAWATIAWQGKLPLFPTPIGWALGLLVAAGAAGFVAAALRGVFPMLPAVLVASAIVVVGASVFAADRVPPTEIVTISGRYLYTGLVAFTLAMAAGWRHFWPGSRQQFRVATRALPLGTQALFVGTLLVPFLVNGVKL